MSEFPDLINCNILVIGLGYVGLPLALEFAKNKICKKKGLRLDRKVTGFDIDANRIYELKKNIDRTNELDAEDFIFLKDINFIDSLEKINKVDVCIVTVPTPINTSKEPDLKPLEEASKTVGKVLKKNFSEKTNATKPIVIYESTVYPGATEEVCIPIIENNSGLKLNEDFFCGYSPERINPGDKKHKNLMDWDSL